MRDVMRRACKEMAAQTRKFGNHQISRHEGRKDEISPSCLCPECRAFYGSYVVPAVEKSERIRSTSSNKIVKVIGKIILRRVDGTRKVHTN